MEVQQHTLNNNVMIAEFVGLKKETFNSGKVNYLFDGTYYEDHELSFDVSLDWIDLALRKIEEFGERTVVIHEDGNYICIIRKYSSDENSADIEKSSQYKHVAIYMAVCTYIDWYNEEMKRTKEEIMKREISLAVSTMIDSLFTNLHSIYNTKSGDITPEQSHRLSMIQEDLVELVYKQIKQNL